MPGAQTLTKLPIPTFKVVKQQYILHNARPEEIVAKWASRTFTIPGVDSIGTSPALYGNGQPIPGTLILEDGYTLDKDGHVPVGGPPNWIASEAIRNLLGVDPDTGAALGDLAKGGVSFLPADADRETVEMVRQDGERRYRQSLEEWARETIGAYEVAHEKAKAAGVDPKPFGKDYGVATKILRGDQPKEKVVDLAGDIDDDLAFMAFAKAKALELAQKAAANTNVNREELAEELLKDPNVREHLKKKFRISEIGKV